MNLIKNFVFLFLISGNIMAQSQPPPPLQGEEPDITLIPY
jgi:hypothetical protein